MKRSSTRRPGRTVRDKGGKPGPLVTIVTVCRNGEKTIARTIECVLRQTYPRIEYLIVDGVSTDRTLEVVKRYEPLFNGRMRWISEKDDGIYPAMNKGIGLARGEIVGLINSDDWYEPEAVELVAEQYREHGPGVYYGILRVIEDGKEVMLKANNHEFMHRDVLGHPAYFVAAAAYREHGLYRTDFKFAADFELMLRFRQERVPFFQINRILSNFSHGGASTANNMKTIEEYMTIRCQYGYMTRKAMLLRLMRIRLGLLIEKINSRI